MFSFKGISRTPKPPLPPVVKRMQWWQRGTMVVCFAATLPIIMLTPLMSRLAWSEIWMPMAIVAPVFVVLFMMRRRVSRITRALKAANGRACVACLYDLSGQAETGVCPECGRAFDAAADQLSWARFYKMIGRSS